MPLLVVDIGNTNIVVGLFEGSELTHSWRLSSRRDTTADEIAVMLRGLLGEHTASVEDAIIASVVPPLTAPMSAALREIAGIDALQIAPGIKTGIRILFDNPQEVGADRILNTVAAHTRYGGPAVVIDLGTATTLDVVTEQGDYVGGIITPGPQLGAEALSARAARLPRVALSVPPRVVGRNTVDSIRSGILHGHAAMLDGLVARVEEELGHAVKIIVTGGMAAAVAPLMRRFDAIDDDLTLLGLRLLYERNRSR